MAQIDERIRNHLVAVEEHMLQAHAPSHAQTQPQVEADWYKWSCARLSVILSRKSLEEAQDEACDSYSNSNAEGKGISCNYYRVYAA